MSLSLFMSNQKRLVGLLLKKGALVCMEVIEESAIAASTTPPKVWKRYVDDRFAIIKGHSGSRFHDTLNVVDPKISFTNETEKNDQISFLDTLITRKKGACSYYRCLKHTHTDRYLDSHHKTQNKNSLYPSKSGTQPPKHR